MSAQRTEYRNYESDKLYAVVPEYVRHSVGEYVILKEGQFYIYRIKTPVVERVNNDIMTCHVIHKVMLYQRS